ncbi:MAG: hypothetical protein LAN71_16765 [Acidobacteriia bacterium]|nr:hypothetical protein [Terriglobia bacterium]
MGYTIAGLKTKILEMYQEIAKYGVIPSLTFDDEKKTYVFKVNQGTPRIIYLNRSGGRGRLHGW